MSAPRPRSIIWFAWSQYSIFGLGFVKSILTFDHQREAAAAGGRGPAFIVFVALLTFAILFFIVWMIAYRRSNAAKWIFLGLNALGLLSLLWFRQAYAQEGEISFAITLVQSALQVFSIWMLFHPDARDWFAARGPVDSRIFC
jgi:hypothetical protein